MIMPDFCSQSLRPGYHFFFALDNCDFQEDTVDGKSSLHDTAINIYQGINDSNERENFAFDDEIEARRLYDLPKTIIAIEECNLPNDIKPECGEFSTFPNFETDLSNTQELCWLAAASFDLSLYKPAQKLLMAAKNEIKNIVLRQGELQVVIALLITICCFINNSGIDAAWLHANLYGQTISNR